MLNICYIVINFIIKIRNKQKNETIINLFLSHVQLTYKKNGGCKQSIVASFNMKNLLL